jgi:hypothetical protein
MPAGVLRRVVIEALGKDPLRDAVQLTGEPESARSESPTSRARADLAMQ